MKKLEIVVRHTRLAAVKDALVALGIHGMNVMDINGFGRQGGHTDEHRGTEPLVEFVSKAKVEVVIDAEMLDAAIEAVRRAAFTGHVGDGKIFVFPVENAVRIRTGETGRAAV
jgi:nitrogen regulatory protein P-II 1